MQIITAFEIEKAVSGVLTAGNGDAEISCAVLDSRKSKPGALYVAVPGERCDGNDFAASALEKGCTVALMSSSRPEAEEAAVRKGAAVILVPDTQQALLDLAEWYLTRFPALIRIGVTGSVGKTGTKEMLWRIFQQKYRTLCSVGNHNNLLGMPMTALEADETTEAAIFEMGMDCFGEIHAMAKVARPSVGIITNVGVSHLERLGSRENIRKAKLEMVDFFDETCALIFNRDNDKMAEFLKETERKTPYAIVTGGMSPGETAEDIVIEQAEDLGSAGISFVLRRGKEIQDFRLPIPGLHNAGNAALAVAAGLRFGISLEEAAAGLAGLEETEKRLRVEENRGIRYIDDTYNASPDSMRAGIDVLMSLEADRRIALLGDMFELGPEENRFHSEVGTYAARKGVTEVWTLGDRSRFLSEAALAGGVDARHFTDREIMKRELTAHLRKGDAVLIKGSRGMKMEEMVEVIQKL